MKTMREKQQAYYEKLDKVQTMMVLARCSCGPALLHRPLLRGSPRGAGCTLVDLFHSLLKFLFHSIVGEVDVTIRMLEAYLTQELFQLLVGKATFYGIGREPVPQFV